MPGDDRYIPRDSDTDPVFHAADPFGLLNERAESTVLVDRIDKAPELYDAVIQRYERA